jgi:GNAT superfamily N-acetyltransferase
VTDPAVLRRATAADAAATAEVFLRSFRFAYDATTVRLAHTDDDVRGWIAEVVIPGKETWVAEMDGVVVGMLALEGDFVDALYVEPSWIGRGIGHQLIELARQQRPGGLQLWTFQENAPARAFYAAHGFEAAEFTDGEGNEEHAPDVRYVWRP